MFVEIGQHIINTDQITYIQKMANEKVRVFLGAKQESGPGRTFGQVSFLLDQEQSAALMDLLRMGPYAKIG